MKFNHKQQLKQDEAYDKMTKHSKHKSNEKKIKMAKHLDGGLVGKLKKAINSKPEDYLGRK